MFRLTNCNTPWLIALLAFILRLFLFPYADVTDSDAVSRVFISEIWLLDPYWVKNGVWGPLHTYFTAIPIFIFNERVVSPVLWHALIGSLLALPVYRFTLRLFNANAAWVASAIVVFNPLIIRTGFQPMAEMPYAFFMTMSLWFILKGLQEEALEKKSMLLAGLFITVAAGMRYESWVLIALLSLVILLYKKWKLLPWFWGTAMVFPMLWMIGNYLEFGNILYSVSYSDYYTTVLVGVNDNLSNLLIVKRLTFLSWSLLHVFPLGLIIPLVGFLGYDIWKQKLQKEQLIWLIPFVVLFVVFVFKAVSGTLLLQHRFTITPFLLLLPFVAVLVPKNFKVYLKIAVVFGIVAHIGFTQIIQKKPFFERLVPRSVLKTALAENRWFSFTQLQAIPKLKDNKVAELLSNTKDYRREHAPLVIDFFGWEETYNFGLNSGVAAQNIVFLSPDVYHAEQNFKELLELKKYEMDSGKALLVLNNGSRNTEHLIVKNRSYILPISNKEISLELVDSLYELRLFTFEPQLLKKIEL